MKKRLLSIAASLTASLAFSVSALAHGSAELGPSGGRIVEFGAHAGVHAEVVLRDGRFVLSLLDAEKKEVPAGAQQLIVTHRETNTKLTPELKDGKWSFAKPDGESFWLILQLKETPDAPSKNGRLHYDATICSACDNAEWLCKCGGEEKKP